MVYSGATIHPYVEIVITKTLLDITLLVADWLDNGSSQSSYVT